MPTDRELELLDVLECELEARPRGAPGVAELLSAVQGVQREPEALVIAFAPAALADVAAFVEAEQRCCAGIGWQLEQEPTPRLRISARPAQLDAIATLFAAR